MKIWPIPSSIFSADVPDRGENGMFEGEYIFKAQKKWLLVNLSIDKRLWKIDQNNLKDWPSLWKIDQNLWKIDQNLWKIDQLIFLFIIFLIFHFEVAQNRGVLIF